MVWNAHAPELWRRTTIAIRRQLARTARAVGAGKVRLSYAKVAEFQARGLVHFHAIFRLDATTPDGQLAPPGLDAAELPAAITAAAARCGSRPSLTRPGPAGGTSAGAPSSTPAPSACRPCGGQAANIAVASYLAKYATKSTEAVGTVGGRITADNLGFYGNSRSHQGRLIRAAWHLGSHTAPDFPALRRWAHMLGYRGHFATKSRRYSTTLRALRAGPRRLPPPPAPSPATSGNDGQAPSSPSPPAMGRDGLAYHWRRRLALSAAARAREHDQAARDAAQAA